MAPNDATEIDEPGSSARPVVFAILAGAWGAALVVAFLVAHPEIVRLPTLVASIVSSSTFESARVVAALGRGAAAVAIATLIAAACYGFGRLVGRLVPESGLEPAALEGAKFVLGLGVVAVVTFVAGRLGLLVPATAVAIVVAGISCLVVSLRGEGAASALAAVRAGVRRAAGDRLVWPIAIACSIVALGVAAAALAPPTARDALTYHLAVPKAYVLAHEIVEIPQNVYSYLPFSAEMLYTLALLLGSDAAAAVLHALVGLMVLAVVYALGVRIGGAPRWGALGAALCATIPTAGWTAGFAHNETIRALALTIAIVAVARWYVEGKPGALVWTGIALGLALSAKHTELVLLPSFALVVLLRIRGLAGAERVDAFKSVVVASLVGAMLPLPWYLQDVAWTGNPLYPYFWDLFPTHHPVWTSERAAMFEGLLRSTYGSHGVLGAVRLPWDVSILGQDELPRRFDGVLGPAFLILAPLVAWLAVVRRDGLGRFAKVAASIVALGFVAWASQSQQIRFLIALAPAAALVGVAALASRSLPRPVAVAFTWVLGAAVVANALVFATGVAAADPVRASLGLEDRDAYLDRRLEYTAYYRTLDEIRPPVGRVMLVDMRNDTYDLNVPVYADYVFEDYTIGKAVDEAGSPDDVYRALRDRGVTHMLVRNDILLNPNLSPFVERSALDRYHAFLDSHTRRVRGDDVYALYELIP